MSSKNIKGIVIDIGGDTTKLSKSLSEVNKEINSTQKELKEVEKRLKLDPGNTELLKQKQELLNDSMEITGKKLEALKTAKKKADDAMANGTEVNSKMYRQLERNIFDAEKAMESMTDEIEEVGDSTKNMGDGFTIGKGLIKDFIVDGVEFLISKTAELIEETREYREDMNKLNTAFIAAEHTTEAAKSVYNDFFKILGESDRSVEAVNHLAQFVKEEKDLAKWGNIAAGVTAAFTDSIAIESLTEAANETAKVSKVTGTLADAINWISAESGVFENAMGDNKKALAAFNKTLKAGEPLEDAFTAALQQMNTEQERSKFITDTLNAAYSDEAKIYKEMNADIMANREATEKLMEAKAAFGAKLEPVMTGAKNILADFAVSGAKSLGIIQSENSKVCTQVKDITTGYSTYRDSIQKNIVSEFAQMETSKALYNELQKLADKNGVVQESDKSRAEYIIGELNEALGLEIEMNGNAIESLDAYGEKIDEIIKKKQAQILLESQEELFAEATKKNTEAKQAQVEAYKALLEAEREHAELSAEDQTRNGIMGSSGAYVAREAELHKLREAYKTATDTVAQCEKDMKTYTDATAAAMEGNVDKVIEILDGEKTARQEAADLTGKTEEEKRRAIGEQLAGAVAEYEVAAENLERVNSESNRKELERVEAHALELAGEYKKLGGQIVDGQVEGMDGKKITLFNKMDELVKGLKDKIISKKGLDIHSPSRWAKKMMEWVDLGLAEGIKKNTSAEDAFEKKVSNLKKKISDFKSEVETEGKLTDSEYELWKLQNPNASARELFAKESGNLMEAIKKQKDKIDLANVSWQEMVKLTGENSEESKKLQLEYIKEQIELEKLNDKMGELIEKRIQALKGSGIDVINAEFELWKLKNPDATEEELFTKEAGNLMAAIKNQTDKVADANKKFEEMKQRAGENTEESQKLQLELINEKIALEELNKEMGELIENRRKAYGSTKGAVELGISPQQSVADYYNYIAKYGGDLKKQGLSNEDIQKAASSMSGYAPASGNVANTTNKNVVINQTINSPEPVSQYETKRGVQLALKSIEIQGGLL